MSVMGNMMKTMINDMSLKEKEKMILVMMPEMMKKSDPHVMLPKMLEEVGSKASLYNVFCFISSFFKREKLKKTLGDRLNTITDENNDMIVLMRPMMIEMMKGMMPKMMKIMKPLIMEGMMKKIVKEKPEMKTHMQEIMLKVCPDMAAEIIPNHKQKQFVEDIIENIELKKLKKLKTNENN
jgi:hypothetical protein